MSSRSYFRFSPRSIVSAAGLAATLAIACATPAPPGAGAGPSAPVALPPGADVAEIARAGEDVPALEPHAVRGKVTVFDFYAVWCAPCRKVDAHVAALLDRRADLAVRKLNVDSWESPLATRYLRDVSQLPLVVVFGRDGRRVDSVTGVDLGALDRAIEKAGVQ